MRRVLGVSEDSTIPAQTALLQSELKTIFSLRDSKATAAAVLAKKEVLSAYKEALGESELSDKDEANIEYTGECPICFEDFLGKKETVDACGICQNGIHLDCIKV